MAILIDFSQVVLSSCYAYSKELSVSHADKENAKNIVRHVILNQLRYYNAKYREHYGKLIVCCDGKNYWRKEYFKFYKESRKKARAEDDMDWKLIFEIVSESIEDLKENFMFPVIKVQRAEGDDVIAILSKYFQNNEMVEDGFFLHSQDILVVSSDKDLVQLQKYPNVKQLSPRTKHLVEEGNPLVYLHEKVIRGDRGDGIPSIINDEDLYVTDKKATPLTKKKFSILCESGYDKCDDVKIKERWKMNRMLIDFDYIPADVETAILESYKEPIKGNRVKIFNYMLKHNLHQLLNLISDFNTY